MTIFTESNYKDLAHVLGLVLGVCDRRYFFYGKRGDYDVVIYTLNPKSPYMFTVAIAAGQGEPITEQQVKEFRKKYPAVNSIQRQGNRFVMHMKNTGSYGRASQNLSDSLYGLITFLTDNGYAPCCQICGQTKESVPYLIEREPLYACPDCATMAQKAKEETDLQKRNKEENIAAGIIGAFLGSILGLASIVLIGKMGYISWFSGVIMGFCTMKGYELLAGKVTKKGIVFSVLLMLIMAYFGDRLLWAWEAAKAIRGIGFEEAFKILPELVKEGYIDSADYLGNLFMLYVFTFGGAIPMINGVKMDQEIKGRVLQIEPLTKE